MKFTYHDQRNDLEEITAKKFSIVKTDSGINIEMEFSEKDADGKLKITLNQPDIRELPKQAAKVET